MGAIFPLRDEWGGPNWYRGVVSGGYPICSFRQFLARMCRFATIQNVTDVRCLTSDRQTTQYVKGARMVGQKKKRIAVSGIPSHSYGMSLGIWDHTVLPAARHK